MARGGAQSAVAARGMQTPRVASESVRGPRCLKPSVSVRPVHATRFPVRRPASPVRRVLAPEIRRAVRPAGPLVNAILDEMATARCCSVATAATLVEALRAVRNSVPSRRSHPPLRRSNRLSLDVPREAQSAMEEDDIQRRTVATVIGFSGKLADVCHLCHLCQSFRRDCRTLLDRTCRGRGGCRHRWDKRQGRR